MIFSVFKIKKSAVRWSLRIAPQAWPVWHFSRSGHKLRWAARARSGATCGFACEGGRRQQSMAAKRKRAGVGGHPPYGEAHPAVHFRVPDGRVLSNTRPRVRPGACADPWPQHCDQASFSSRIRSVSPCAWAARSDTALAASAMASAVCLDMSLTWTMD